MNGDPLLVSALLEMNADPNDATKQSKIMAPWWKVVVDWLQDGIYVINIDNKKKKMFFISRKTLCDAFSFGKFAIASEKNPLKLS